MKYLLAVLLISTTVLAFGQGSVDFGQIIRSWTQGKIGQNGIVVQADINKGGWYQLNISPDTTVIFRDPDWCGFGYERHGKWSLNQADSTVRFSFSKKVGYLASPGTTDINETESYKIKKLAADELILERKVDGKERKMAFIRTSKL